MKTGAVKTGGVLTIGQLAAYAGVTVRAVRHYHATGLLAEPQRDPSGYRRYDADAVVELIRIRTLAQAGVPLARVRQLLAADEEEFAAEVAEIDRRLRSEIRELQRHRDRIAQLAAGESLALPPEAVAYLDRLRALGISERMVAGERDAWILVAAQVPQHMAFYMAMKQQQLTDPATVALYRDLADLIEWPSPDDPRLPEVADRLAAILEVTVPAQAQPDLLPDELVDLLDSVFLDKVPVARRLTTLLEERGWHGWTRMERVCARLWTDGGKCPERDV